jgi:hypothetical protein
MTKFIVLPFAATILLALLKVFLFQELPLFVIFLPIFLYCFGIVVVGIVVMVLGIYFLKELKTILMDIYKDYKGKL